MKIPVKSIGALIFHEMWHPFYVFQYASIIICEWADRDCGLIGPFTVPHLCSSPSGIPMLLLPVSLCAAYAAYKLFIMLQ